jgi:enterochelin esterase-like enzyme
MNRTLLLAPLFFAASALAQTAPKPSHQPTGVNPDRSITFRYFNPGAQKVSIALDLYDGHPIAMTRDDAGEWTMTTAPLPPESYGYNLNVDGDTVLDPLNANVRANYAFLASQILVPGTPPAPWELTAVPHGHVEHITYTSQIVKNLPANQSAYTVYTPPGYDAHRKVGYPVLYLLHGWSDKETAWTDIGRAQYILDNLIAAHKAVPMIVVMPLGYGDLGFTLHGFNIWQNLDAVRDNTSLFSQALLTEVLPAVEHSYNVAPGRENRAIAGLSMGGLETFAVGLNHTDQFAWIGGMSGAVQGDFIPSLPNLDAKTANLRLLWIGCGLDEPLLKPNRQLLVWAQAHHLPATSYEIPGAHVWLTWRDDLVHLAPLLFQPK